ncbi:MAG TPA: hypothetical protein VGS58_14445 [Candidatus Sulfopaludibacter sp.]|nr:hypothetical protein [Candidatus Sulfopaludibacter sp.]
MADHLVKLHYTANPDPAGKPLFKPDPATIFINKGDTISFQKGDGSLPGTIHIKFDNPEIFSVPETDGSSDVVVTGTPINTSYQCRLLGWDGAALADSAGAPDGGGDMQPSPPPPAS